MRVWPSNEQTYSLLYSTHGDYGIECKLNIYIYVVYVYMLNTALLIHCDSFNKVLLKLKLTF